MRWSGLRSRPMSKRRSHAFSAIPIRNSNTTDKSQIVTEIECTSQLTYVRLFELSAPFSGVLPSHYTITTHLLSNYSKFIKTLNTNRCIVLQSMYYFYYLAPTCFGTVAILRELTPRYQQSIQQYIMYSKHTFVFMWCVCLL
jgi:hypothetical protein